MIKNAIANKIILIENDEILSDSKIVAQTLNNHLVNITESFNIARPFPDNVPQTSADVAEIFNLSFSDKTFPFLTKMANVCPIFKNENSTSKENYRPMSVLPSASKIFERIMFNQIYN